MIDLRPVVTFYLLLVIVLGATLSACAPSPVVVTTPNSTSLSATPASSSARVAASVNPLPSLAPMIKRISPAVVNIATEGRTVVRPNPLLEDPFFRRFFNLPEQQQQPRERRTESLGSGVIIDAAKGYVVTNHHVIDKSDQITVTLTDGRQLRAKIIGSDPEADVAVIQVQGQNLIALSLANSDDLQVGDFVVAIGNPFGLGQTVTSGIVSALGRSGLGIEGYEDFIQTDASINPGNSGGALVNLRGQLVGINTAILAPTGGNIGISFAIPTNMVRQLVDQLLQYGRVDRGQLGVTVQDLNPQLAQAFGINNVQGALITQVLPNSAAAGAGLKLGDVVVAVNNKPIRDASGLRNTIGLLRVGDSITVDLLRNGQRLRLTARISSRT